MDIFSSVVAPMLQKAQILVEVVKTAYQYAPHSLGTNHLTLCSQHAVEIFRDLNVSRYAAIVFFSGDTTLNEGLTGIFENCSKDEVETL